MQVSKSKQLRQFLVATVVAVSAVLSLGAAPAQAVEVQPRTASCTTSMEVCRDTRSSFSASTANLKTITSNVSSGTAYYTVNKGVTGAVICSGYMGYNATKTCSLGGYTGQLTFTFYKGQGSLTTISLY